MGCGRILQISKRLFFAASRAFQLLLQHNKKHYYDVECVLRNLLCSFAWYVWRHLRRYHACMIFNFNVGND